MSIQPKNDQQPPDKFIPKEEIEIDVEKAISSDSEDSNKAVNALKEYDNPRTFELLSKIVGSEDRDFQQRLNALKVFGEFNDPFAAKILVSLWVRYSASYNENIYGEFLNNIANSIRKIAYKRLDAIIIPIIESIPSHNDYTTYRYSVSKLLDQISEILDQSVTESLVKILQDEDGSVREIIAGILGKLKDERAIKPLITALFIEEYEPARSQISWSLAEFPEWSPIATHITQSLKTSSISRENLKIKIPHIRAAISLSHQQRAENPNVVEEFFIQQASENREDIRLCGIIADLMLDRMLRVDVIRLIAEFEKANNLTENELSNLRISIGSQEALESLLKKLSDNLDNDFKPTIKNLNDGTQEQWKSTIRAAKWGFIVRIVMSVIVFLVGIILVLASSYKVLIEGVSSDELIGPSISFFSGLATVFAVIYTGPLIEIRKSVTDLGVANATFISFIHRVMQISTTYSYLYLKEQIDYSEIQKANVLLENATRDTIIMLHLASPDKKTLAQIWQMAGTQNVNNGVVANSEATDD